MFILEDIPLRPSRESFYACKLKTRLLEQIHNMKFGFSSICFKRITLILEIAVFFLFFFQFNYKTSGNQARVQYVNGHYLGVDNYLRQVFPFKDIFIIWIAPPVYILSRYLWEKYQTPTEMKC